MNKELIKKRFSRKLNVYNENAKIQKIMAAKLIDLLPSNKCDSILEIGCGTGLLTEMAVKNIKYKNYTAVDIVPDCKKFISDISSDIEFINNDAEDFINNSNKYDLILSNASLQWMENLPLFIKKLTEKLTNNGYLLFSTFGKENFKEIYHTLGKTLNYYSPEELSEILSDYNIHIVEEKYVMKFKTPTEVLKHIRNTGVNALSSEYWTKKNLVDFIQKYNIYCLNHPFLTYNPIYTLISAKIG